MFRALGDLVLRRDCVCCGRVIDFYSTPHAPSSAGRAFGGDVCAPCAAELSAPWQQWYPPAVAVPVFAAGAYGGARRTLVISAKDRLRGGAIRMMGRVFDAGLRQVASRGLIPDPRWGRVAVLPAPTRRSAAKQRGGDVVTRAAVETASVVAARGGVAPGAGVGVFQISSLREAAQDSVGLSRTQRRANIAHNLVVDAGRARRAREFLHGRDQVPAAAVIVDDVCTTGATASQYAISLASMGIEVAAVLVIAAA